MATHHLDPEAKDLLASILNEAISTYDDTSRQGDMATAMVLESAENGDRHAETIIRWTLRTHLGREASTRAKASLGKIRTPDGQLITGGGGVPTPDTATGNTQSWRQIPFEAMTLPEFKSWGRGWMHRADAAENALAAYRLGIALYDAFPTAQTLGEALQMKGCTAEQYFGDIAGMTG